LIHGKLVRMIKSSALFVPEGRIISAIIPIVIICASTGVDDHTITRSICMQRMIMGC
jgi:hypothetical protein